MAKADLGPGFLRADDLISNGVWVEKTYTIKSMHPPNTVEGPDKKLIDKPVIEFEETPQRMVLGNLNKRLLIHEIGSRVASGCVGKRITLYVTIGNWFGQKNVTGLRIRVTGSKPQSFLKPATVGEEITGRKFSQVPAATPEPPGIYTEDDGTISDIEAERIRLQEIADSTQ